jgi:hypothetical protein
MPPLASGRFCFAHAPERGAARARARASGGRRSRTRTPTELPAEPPKLRDVESIQVQLELAYFDTQAQPNCSHRSRTLGYLLGMALRALEVGELESRLEALEQRMGTPHLVA